MVFLIGQNMTVHFDIFSKTNTDPYSMTQDSTLDTPQGGVLGNTKND